MEWVRTGIGTFVQNVWWPFKATTALSPMLLIVNPIAMLKLTLRS